MRIGIWSEPDGHQSRRVCERRGKAHPHNAGSAYTHGFYCRDCGTFFKEGTREYDLFRGKLNPLHIGFVLWNRRANLIINKQEVPQSLNELIEKYDTRNWGWNGETWTDKDGAAIISLKELEGNNEANS